MTRKRTKGKIVPKVARKKTVSLLTGNKKVVCNEYCRYNMAIWMVARARFHRSDRQEACILWVPVCRACYARITREHVNEGCDGIIIAIPFDEFERLLAPAITRELVAGRLEGVG